EVAAVHPRGAAQVSDAHRPYHHRRQRVHAAADPLGLAAERLSGERVRVHQERDDRGRGATRPGEQREGLLHGRGQRGVQPRGPALWLVDAVRRLPSPGPAQRRGPSRPGGSRESIGRRASARLAPSLRARLPRPASQGIPFGLVSRTWHSVRGAFCGAAAAPGPIGSAERARGAPPAPGACSAARWSRMAE
ncbi:unnamed protein product, partial [Prorocentrum cordatum]